MCKAITSTAATGASAQYGNSSLGAKHGHDAANNMDEFEAAELGLCDAKGAAGVTLEAPLSVEQRQEEEKRMAVNVPCFTLQATIIEAVQASAFISAFEPLFWVMHHAFKRNAGTALFVLIFSFAQEQYIMPSLLCGFVAGTCSYILKVTLQAPRPCHVRHSLLLPMVNAL